MCLRLARLPLKRDCVPLVWAFIWLKIRPTMVLLTNSVIKKIVWNQVNRYTDDPLRDSSCDIKWDPPWSHKLNRVSKSYKPRLKWSLYGIHSSFWNLMIWRILWKGDKLSDFVKKLIPRKIVRIYKKNLTIYSIFSFKWIYIHTIVRIHSYNIWPCFL